MLAARDRWVLRLYVAGRGALATRARDNLERLCREHIKEHYRIDVVDVLEQPALAAEHGIIALPMVVREAPVPIRKMVGDLSDTRRALSILLLLPSPRPPPHHFA